MLGPKRLLIVTQKVNSEDQILGFFVAWIREFAKHFDLVTVVCLEKGEVSDKSVLNMPANVRIFSLGKEKKQSRLNYVYCFYSYIWSMRADYDVVLVHMNPIYVLMGGPIWKLLSKKIALWYTHKNVDLKLRMATFLVDRVFSASKESFRLKTKKLLVTGHGIDTDVFSPFVLRQSKASKSVAVGQFKCISVARISKAKNQLVMVEAIEILARQGFEGSLTIVGDAITPEDRVYKNNIHSYIDTHELVRNKIIFTGSLPHDAIEGLLGESDLFINLSTTGSLDKAILESMASGLQVLTSNEAYTNILLPENITTNIPDDVAGKIKVLSAQLPHSEYREYVIKNHSLSNLIARLYDELARL